MKFAADFRAEARDALRGKWPLAILTGFVASLIGANISIGGGGSSSSGQNDTVNTLIQGFQTNDFWFLIQILAITVAFFLIVWVIAVFVIGGAGKLGYALFNLKLVDKQEPEFKDLFSQFHRLGDGFCMNFMMTVYTLLWMMLLIIPGIIKSYSYAMTPYILAENPDMTATEAITESRRIMNGNKWRLFCLGFSFVGWDLLCAVPLIVAWPIISLILLNTKGITGFLWIVPAGILSFIGILLLKPYRETAWAAFYRDVSAAATKEAPVSPENEEF